MNGQLMMAIATVIRRAIIFKNVLILYDKI
jgi:hypothetical protein